MASTAHTGTTEQLLAMIHERGSIFALDLAAEFEMEQSRVMDLLERKLDDGLIAKDLAYPEPGSGHRRQLVRYTWVEQAVAQKAKKPCLGGCGRKIPRDGVTFLCVSCRTRNAGASPYAP